MVTPNPLYCLRCVKKRAKHFVLQVKLLHEKICSKCGDNPLDIYEVVGEK